MQHGKEFDGSAFCATPANLVFRDFVPGSTYSAVLTITNGGYAKNTFKLGELAPQLAKVGDVYMVAWWRRCTACDLYGCAAVCCVG